MSREFRCDALDTSLAYIPTNFFLEPKLGHETEGVGPKRALLGAPGVPQRSLKRPEHTIWMLPTQLDQPVAVGTKSGSFVPSEDLQGPLRTSRAPKRAFLGL